MNKLIFTLLLSLAPIHAWTQEASGYEKNVREAITSIPKDKSDENQDHVARQETTSKKILN